MRRSLALLIILSAMPVWAGEGCRRAQGLAKGKPAPCAGVILPIDAARKCARRSLDLKRCQIDLLEAERQVAFPLPQICTPTTIEVIKPVPSKRPVWQIAVAAVAGVIVGAVSAWGVSHVTK